MGVENVNFSAMLLSFSLCLCLLLFGLENEVERDFQSTAKKEGRLHYNGKHQEQGNFEPHNGNFKPSNNLGKRHMLDGCVIIKLFRFVRQGTVFTSAALFIC